MFLTDLLEKLKLNPNATQLEQLKADAVKQYKVFEEKIASRITGPNTIDDLLVAIERAYMIHPNRLLNNLEQLSQLYDQVYKTNTLTPPMSYLMQIQKTLLPTYLFADEATQQQIRTGMEDFFAPIDLSKTGEILEGQTLYASWALAKWIREKTVINKVLSPDQEIEFSSYCVLFVDNIVKSLHVDVDPNLLLKLVHGPQYTEYNVTFEDVMVLELQFWRPILEGILGDEAVLAKRVPLLQSAKIAAFDEKYVFEYVRVPEQAHSFFDKLGVSVKQFYLAETFTTIVEAVESIVTKGLSAEELSALNAFLKVPAKALEKPEKRAEKKSAKKVAKKAK